MHDWWSLPNTDLRTDPAPEPAENMSTSTPDVFQTVRVDRDWTYAEEYWIFREDSIGDTPSNLPNHTASTWEYRVITSDRPYEEVGSVTVHTALPPSWIDVESDTGVDIDVLDRVQKDRQDFESRYKGRSKGTSVGEIVRAFISVCVNHLQLPPEYVCMLLLACATAAETLP